MSIFGTTYCIFKSGITEYDVRYSIIKPTWRVPQIKEHVSIVNGTTNFIKLSEDKMRFTIIANVWKMASPTVWMPAALGLNHGTFKFMPHENHGEYIKETDGVTEADFYITEMKPFYLNTEPPALQDRLLVKIESLGGTSMLEGVVKYLVDEGDQFLVDESGDKLVGEIL